MIGVDKSRVPEPMIHLLFITTLRELIHELLTSKDSYAWSTHSAPCFHQGQLRPPRRNEKPSPMSHKGKSKQDKIGRWNTGWCYFAQEIFEGKVMKVYPQNENKRVYRIFSIAVPAICDQLPPGSSTNLPEWHFKEKNWNNLGNWIWFPFVWGYMVRSLLQFVWLIKKEDLGFVLDIFCVMLVNAAFICQ